MNMKKYTNHRFLVLVLIISCCASIHAQADLTLMSVAIPAELKKNADAVVRYSDTKVILTAIDKYESYNSYAITVLKNDGVEFLNFALGYEKYITAL